MECEGIKGGKRKTKMGEMSVDSSDGQKLFGEKRFLVQKNFLVKTKIW